MADHGEVQYATATANDLANDLAAHEAGYSQFVTTIFVASALVVNVVFGLAIGGVLDRWLPATLIIVAGVIAAATSAWTGSRTVSIGMVAISGLTLLFNAYS